MKDAPTPTIGKELADGSLVELVHDREAGTTALALGASNGSIDLAPQLTLPSGEELIPYAASNNLLASGCVLLPSAIGSFDTQARLVTDIITFLRRYVQLSPEFEELAAHYVLFSWVYDAFNEAPILRVRGDLGSGKSRALLAIGSLCYRSFFASGASTVSPIFHILDTFQGTLVLDESDFRFSDATAELVKLLNNGTVRGFPILRTMTNRHRELNPTAFRVFGPKIIAMRAHFEDDALESRCITEEMGPRVLRPDIPLVTPDTLRAEAQLLRNDLLAWRFSMRGKVRIEPDRAVPGLSPRGNQMALPLLSLVDDAGARQRLAEHLLIAEDRARARRASQPHVEIATALHRLFRDGNPSHVPVARLTEEYNASTGCVVPIKSVGHIVRNRLGLETRKSAGVYVIPAHEREKIAGLVEKFTAVT